MRRAVPISLSPDEHCAVHHFIRVHGRRPTPDELREACRTSPDARPPTPAGSTASLADGFRRSLAQLLARL